MKIADLLEQRSRAVVEMRSLADKAEVETRDLNAEEDKRFKELKTEISGLDTRIERAKVVAEAERAAPAILHSGRLGDGAYEKRASEFSVTKAIRASLPRDIGGGDVDAGFEREISQEVARRSGRTFHGIAVPDEVFVTERRTLLAGSTAADLIPNVHRPDLFIDRLRSSLITGRLGATVLDGLVGTLDIPRQTGSSTAQWVGEDGSLTETDAAFDDVTLAPRTVGAVTSYSRRTLLSATPSVEQIVRNDLAAVIANAIDGKAMIGDGTSNTPTGILHVEEVSQYDMGGVSSPSWLDVLSMIATVDGADALTGSMGWAMSAFARKKFHARTKDISGNGATEFIMNEPNLLAGYRAEITSMLPGLPDDDSASPATPRPGTLIFGNWASLLIGYWSGTDLLVNPYETTAYAKGRILVRAMRDCDVQIRHPESFVFADDMNVEGA